MKILYAVECLKKDVKVTDAFKNSYVLPVHGVYGFIPVFETKEEAESESLDGKFRIFEITEQ